MDIKGGVVIVTGSSSGIGEACVKLLADKGANVVVNYSRSVEAAEAVAEDCRRRGVEALVVQADVSKDEECKKLAAAAMDEWGRIDGLINNAGTTKFVGHDDLDGLSEKDQHHDAHRHVGDDDWQIQQGIENLSSSEREAFKGEC